jgi:RHS repeat-associated protein
VWRTSTRDDGLDRDQRITIALTDLIQSTTAVIDLATGELVETGSYYANGARETYRSNESETVAPEPMGFTGKEADEEVGLTYFGQRYLMAHLGRWASPDPLQTHAVGGGEAVNGYHYVAGALLARRDAFGLDIETTGGLTARQAVDAIATSPQLGWAVEQGYIHVTGENTFAVDAAPNVPESWTAAQREVYSLLVTASESNQWRLAGATQVIDDMGGGQFQSVLRLDPSILAAHLPWRADVVPGQSAADAPQRPVTEIRDPRATGRAQPVGTTVPTPAQLYAIRPDVGAAYGPGNRSGDGTAQSRGLAVVATSIESREVRGGATRVTSAAHPQSQSEVGETIVHELAVHAARISMGQTDHGHEGPDSRRIMDSVDSFFPRRATGSAAPVARPHR